MTSFQKQLLDTIKGSGPPTQHNNGGGPPTQHKNGGGAGPSGHTLIIVNNPIRHPKAPTHVLVPVGGAGPSGMSINMHPVNTRPVGGAGPSEVVIVKHPSIDKEKSKYYHEARQRLKAKAATQPQLDSRIRKWAKSTGRTCILKRLCRPRSVVKKSLPLLNISVRENYATRHLNLFKRIYNRKLPTRAQLIGAFPSNTTRIKKNRLDNEELQAHWFATHAEELKGNRSHIKKAIDFMHVRDQHRRLILQVQNLNLNTIKSELWKEVNNNIIGARPNGDCAYLTVLHQMKLIEDPNKTNFDEVKLLRLCVQDILRELVKIEDQNLPTNHLKSVLANETLIKPMGRYADHLELTIMASIFDKTLYIMVKDDLNIIKLEGFEKLNFQNLPCVDLFRRRASERMGMGNWPIVMVYSREGLHYNSVNITAVLLSLFKEYQNRLDGYVPNPINRNHTHRSRKQQYEKITHFLNTFTFKPRKTPNPTSPETTALTGGNRKKNREFRKLLKEHSTTRAAKRLNTPKKSTHSINSSVNNGNKSINSNVKSNNEDNSLKLNNGNKYIMPNINNNTSSTSSKNALRVSGVRS